MDAQGWRAGNAIDWIKEYRRRTGCWLKDAKAAYDAGRDMPGSSWRDIETAPKGGIEPILAWIQYTPDEAIRAGRRGRLEVARWSPSCEGWLLDQDAFNEHHRITHWQPVDDIPPPPDKET
jgi:hypothetical protein